ncbi:MAG: hypothetical protein LUD02_11100 [Tannerellaceae bacterium]|nr:hypothetical protein [Tannerellaceae bacterium]
MENTITFRESSTEVLKDRFIGMVHTDWGSAEGFMKEYELVKKANQPAPIQQPMLFTTCSAK